MKRYNARKGSFALEYLIVVTIVVIGSIAGLASLRTSIALKMQDLGSAVDNMNVTFVNSSTNP